MKHLLIKLNSQRIGILCFFLSISVSGLGQEAFNQQQKEVIATMEALSNTTSPNGGGSEAYGKFLTEGFNRWTLGSERMSDKLQWLEGINGWFEDGWRVVERSQKTMDIEINDKYAFTRRIVIETYLSPKDERSSSKAALSEVWVRSNGKWLLHRVNVHPFK